MPGYHPRPGWAPASSEKDPKGSAGIAAAPDEVERVSEADLGVNGEDYCRLSVAAEVAERLEARRDERGRILVVEREELIGGNRANRVVQGGRLLVRRQ